MNRNRISLVCIVIFFSLLFVLTPVRTGAQEKEPQIPETVNAPIGTAFTYQGRLTVTGVPANGSHNFRFFLWDDAIKTTLLGTYPSVGTIAINVVNGYFTAVIDFGVGIFAGAERWIEIEVNGTLLAPLQNLTPAPYAIYAQTAPWSGVLGMPAGFADGIDNDTTTFWSLSGNSGTIPSAQYLGTNDNKALVLRVNATEALRLEPNSITPNLIGGNYNNTVSIEVYGGTISGGGTTAYPNYVTDSGGTVSGGVRNRAGNNAGTTEDRLYATVGGGYNNTASGYSSTISGGDTNTSSGFYSTVGGGWGNTASGSYSTVSGGDYCFATGSKSFAAGSSANATHDGSFVWSSYSSTYSWGANTFTARAHGGARFYTASGTSTGVQLAGGGGSWSSLSDRNLKQNIIPVNTLQVLEKVAGLPINTWNYTSQDASIRHMGPMAQDFYTTFGLGEDERYIGTLDAEGVALASIQGLYRINQEQAAQVKQLRTENEQLVVQLATLDARLNVLERGEHPQNISLPGILIGAILAGVTGYCAPWFRRRFS